MDIENSNNNNTNNNIFQNSNTEQNQNEEIQQQQQQYRMNYNTQNNYYDEDNESSNQFNFKSSSYNDEDNYSYQGNINEFGQQQYNQNNNGCLNKSINLDNFLANIAANRIEQLQQNGINNQQEFNNQYSDQRSENTGFNQSLNSSQQFYSINHHFNNNNNNNNYDQQYSSSQFLQTSTSESSQLSSQIGSPNYSQYRFNDSDNTNHNQNNQLIIMNHFDQINNNNNNNNHSQQNYSSTQTSLSSDKQIPQQSNSSIDCQYKNQINSKNQEFKQSNLSVVPIYRNVKPREIYLIYGEVLVELDFVLDANVLERSSGYNSFKKIVSVKQRQENGYVEVLFDTFSQPLRDFQFLVERVKSKSCQTAYELSKIIEQYQLLVQRQTADDEQLRLKYSQKLIQDRSEYCAQKSEELISILDENATVMYYQVKMNTKTFEPMNFKQGFSRKLAWVFGCSPEILTTLFMRYGQLDFAKCASKIEMAFQKVLINYTDMQKEKFMRDNNCYKKDDNLDSYITQNHMRFEMQSIDDLMIPMDVIVSRINLSQEFDNLHNITGFIPECLFICDVTIDLHYMHMLIKKRCETFKPIDEYVSSFIKSHQIQESNEYYDKSKQFLEKFYPKDEDNNGRILVKPKFKKVSNTNNINALYSQNNRVSDETLNQIYSILHSQS